MCGKGSNTTSQDSSSTSASALAANPAAAASYYNLLNKAQGVASTPYQPYTGQEVAPTNWVTGQGINQVAQDATYGLGTINAAGQPINSNDISNYQNPYTQDVVNATQADFDTQNARANSIVTGNAAAQGALGGDRVGVAQALTQEAQNRVQAPVIANLRSSGFQNAVNTAEADKARQLQSGISGQNAALQGGNATIAAGNVWQQNLQAQDTQARADYFQQQGYPFETAQWLAGIEAGIGPKLGNTSVSATKGTGLTAGPTPNTWAQLLGLGVAGAGLFLDRGGRVNRAAGGFSGPWAGADNWVMGAKGWVPKNTAAEGDLGAHPRPTASTAPKLGSVDPSGDNLVKQAFGFAKKWQDSPDDPSMVTGAAGDYAVPTYMARGGGVRRGYDDGGMVDDSWPRAGYGMASGPSFADRAAPTTEAIASGVFDPQGANYTDFAAPTLANGSVPLPRPRPEDAPSAADESDDEADDAVDAVNKAAGVAKAGVPAAASAFDRNSPTAGFGAPPAKNFLGLNKVSPEVRDALIAAGLGMMATRRGGPGSFLGAAGEGGLAGVNAYTAAQKAQADRELAAQKLQMEQQRIQRENAAQVETARHNKVTENQESYSSIGSADVDGQIHPLVVAKSSGKVIDAVTGQPPKSDDKLSVKGAPKAEISDDDARAIAQYTVATGDDSRLKGLGYSGTNRVKVQAAINAEKADKGVDDAEYARRRQDFSANGIGKNAAARTQGVREENLNLILRATDAAIPAALEASEKVARTGLVPLNRIIQGGRIMTSDPDQVQFGMANLQLAEHWARAMNPLGVMRESDRDLALKYLDTALSQGTYRAALSQLKTQITRERDAVRAGKTTTEPGKEPVPGVSANPSLAPTASSATPTITSKSDYDALKAGTQFRDKDGKLWTKP